MPTPLRLVALVSGGGTTLQNLLDRSAAGRLAGVVVGVVSSRADAYGVERAKRAGVPVAVVERARPVEAVWAAVRGFAPDLVCLAGWLHLLPIPDDFRHRVLNIHPSLLPAFGGRGMYGRYVHEAVLAYGAKVTGCTVHFADDTYDTGPIVVQKCVPVEAGDDADALAARVFRAECEAYPEAIGLVAAGRVRVDGRRVVISGESRGENMPAAAAVPPNSGDRPARTFAVGEYLKMFEVGVLTEDDRVELLEGRIVRQLPRGPEHDRALTVFQYRFRDFTPDSNTVSCRCALLLPDSVPEPDFTVARGDETLYRSRHPGPADTALVIEVSASSLRHDRTDKARIYARAGIPVYWVVNVIDHVVEVYTQPSGPADAPAYADRQDYPVGTAVPVVLDGTTVGTIPVAGIMG